MFTYGLRMTLCALASVVPLVAHGQTISVTVENSFGQTINLSSNTCNNSTCSPVPPSTIANGATSTPFGAVTGTGQSEPQITTRYHHSSGSQDYGCQFQASAVTVGATCSTPVISQSSYAGVYPSPHCNLVSQSTNPSNCNLTVVFQMAQ
jgi:hypothetical protein